MFGIIGKLFENIREWSIIHADTSKTVRVIPISNPETDIFLCISLVTEFENIQCCENVTTQEV